ncbi:MAG: RNA polymerase sporulation sigma factor SigK [Ruminococcaceae bacterium]|nr:RNA polymerase sporulation sigma factor SigK [Oscillospiraceae bacterium]
MFEFLFGFFSDLIFRVFLHGYVSNNYTFPKPLTPSEENEYLKRSREGDEKARAMLIEHNLRLVAHIAKKYSPTTLCDSDDLISIGTIGLIKAIDSFDENKNIRLATYASRCIANEILMVMRAAKSRARETSLQEPIGTDSEGNTISLLNVITGSDEEIDDEISLKMQIKKLYEAIEKTLSNREKRVIKMRYGLYNDEPLTQREIAKLLKISRSYVSRIETGAINKLRGEFGDDE